MAPSIYDWSTTAANNATADSGINWAEGQAPSTVNNSARQVMGRVAEFLDDIGGVVTEGGTANAITVTTNSAFTSYATGQLFSFKATADNTGATTISANAIGAKAVRKFTAAGEVALAAGDIQQDGVYLVIYDAALNSAAGGWHLLHPSTVALIGLTDSATGSRVTIADTLTAFGTTGAAYTIRKNDDDQSLIVRGGTGANAAVLTLNGGTTASTASDYSITAGGSVRYAYDFSALTHAFTGAATFSSTVATGALSVTGAISATTNIVATGGLVGSSVTIGGGTPVDILNLSSYTPTISDTVNITSTASPTARWYRIGNRVIVDGEVTIDPSVTSGTGSFQMTIPVASDFSNTYELTGIICSTGITGVFAAETTNNRVNCAFRVIDGAGTNATAHFHFEYQVF